MMNLHRASGFGLVAGLVLSMAADALPAQSVRPAVVIAASSILRQDRVRNAYLNYRSTGRARTLGPE